MPQPNYFFFLSAYIDSEVEREKLRNLFNETFKNEPGMIRRSYVLQPNGICTFSQTSEKIIGWEAMSKFRDEILRSESATLLQLLSNCHDNPPVKIGGIAPEPATLFCKPAPPISTQPVKLSVAATVPWFS